MRQSNPRKWHGLRRKYLEILRQDPTSEDVQAFSADVASWQEKNPNWQAENSAKLYEAEIRKKQQAFQLVGVFSSKAQTI